MDHTKQAERERETWAVTGYCCSLNSTFFCFYLPAVSVSLLSLIDQTYCWRTMESPWRLFFHPVFPTLVGHRRPASCYEFKSRLADWWRDDPSTRLFRFRESGTPIFQGRLHSNRSAAAHDLNREKDRRACRRWSSSPIRSSSFVALNQRNQQDPLVSRHHERLHLFRSLYPTARLHPSCTNELLRKKTIGLVFSCVDGVSHLLSQ